MRKSQASSMQSSTAYAEMVEALVEMLPLDQVTLEQFMLI